MVVYETGQYIQEADLKAIEIAVKNWGVMSGLTNELEVTFDSTPATISVNTGSAFINEKKIDKASASEIVLTQDASHPKKALIVINDSGTISASYGTAAAAYPDVTKTGINTPIPRPPSIPASSIVLAECWIPASGTDMTDDDIYDKRFMIVLQRYIEARTDDPTDLWNGRIWLRTDL